MAALPISRDWKLYPPAAARASFRWKQGDAYVDFTGWTARLQVRESHGSAVLLDLTTSNGGVMLDSTGHITVLATATQVSALEEAVAEGSARYQLVLKPPSGGDPVSFLTGQVLVAPSYSVAAP